MKSLTLRWQRLLDDRGETCPRCADTQTEVHRALRTLREALRPLDIDVNLEEGRLPLDAFVRDPLESNRIWVGDRPLEEWLAAEVGASPCCATCGEAECRLLEVDGVRYEAIPAELIVKAGMRAAAELIALPADRSCCQPGAAQSRLCCLAGCCEGESAPPAPDSC